MNNTNLKNSKKCKHCQSEIDPKAKICPNCRKKQGMPKWIIFLIIVVILVVFASSTGDNEDGNANSSTSGNVQQSEKFTYTITDEYDNGFSYYIYKHSNLVLQVQRQGIKLM